MTRLNKAVAPSGAGYCEESPKLAIIITIVAVALASTPLVLLNKKISDAGSRAADVSAYAMLALTVEGNVKLVREMLEKGVVHVVAVPVVAAPKVTLITPDIAPTNMQEATSQDPNTLNVKLSAIYWNPHAPLVTIDNENYQVGDKVKGFTILEIRETEVVFRSPLGDKIVKYFYDYLDKPKAR